MRRRSRPGTRSRRRARPGCRAAAPGSPGRESAAGTYSSCLSALFDSQPKIRSRASAATSRRTDTAAAATRLSLSTWEKMKNDAAWVLNGRFPASKTSEPNSPTARANASPPPAMIAGVKFGRMMRRKTVALPAPSDSAACSISRSSSSSTGYSSRTSTQAISVPKNALTITTISDAISVSLSAATASGLLTAFQKPSVPFSNDLKTTAASGISATTLRYAMATPRPRAAPGIGRALGPRLTGAAGGGAAMEVASVGGSALPLGLEDLRHDALLGVEEVRVHLVPAPELADLEQAGRRRELIGPLRALHDRAIALADEDLLGLRRVQEVHELLRQLGGGRLRGGRDRVLDQDRLIRHHVVELLALLLREDGLVLVAEEHVSLAARERLKRLARALVEHRHVLEQLGQVLLGLGGRLALLELSAVRGHDVPLRAAGGERVRLEHLDVAGHEVVPVLDVLRVALTDHEHNDGLGDHALVLVLVPIGLDEAGLDKAGHVGLERELDDVRGQAALDGAGLLAR